MRWSLPCTDRDAWGKRCTACSSRSPPAPAPASPARQTWLQHNPPNVLDCGPDLAYMLDSFPLSQALPKIFKGEGDCAKVSWTFLGLSIAEWALVWFVLFVLAGSVSC